MPDNASPIIFSTSSSADLALTTYYLDDRQRQHILLGHRGLQNAIGAIETTVSSPTHVYRSMTEDNRLLFVSFGVLIGSGRPMKVVIERVDNMGKIITATWSGPKFSEQIVWESSAAIYTNYDDTHDVFYVSKGGTAVDYAEDDPEYPSVWLRKKDSDNSPYGATVFGLLKPRSQDREAIFRRIAAFLGVTVDDIRLRVPPLVRI